MKYDVQLERKATEVRVIMEFTEVEIEAASREEAEAKLKAMLDDEDFDQDRDWEWNEVDYDIVDGEVTDGPNIIEIQEAGE